MTDQPKPDRLDGDDPTSSAQWNEGCDFAMTQLCIFLGVDPASVTWDAATETVDGDVRAVIGGILRAKFGEDWGPSFTLSPTRDAAEGAEDAEWCKQAKATLEHLGGFLQKTGAPHRVDWREWIDSADKHLGLKWPSEAQASAPPKPAPDAMREALEPFALAFEAMTEEDLAVEGVDEMKISDVLYKLDYPTIGDLRKAHAALSAPVPPADGIPLKTLIDCAVDLANNYEPSEAISLIDDAPPVRGDRETYAALARNYWRTSDNKPIRKDYECLIGRKIAAAILEMPPSGTVAADQILMGFHQPELLAVSAKWEARFNEVEHQLLSTVQVLHRADEFLGTLGIFEDNHVREAIRALSLPVPPGAGERETVIEECAKIATSDRFAGLTKVSTFKGSQWTEETGNAELMNSHARSIAAAIRALSRQAPHSGDGEGR